MNKFTVVDKIFCLPWSWRKANFSPSNLLLSSIMTNVSERKNSLGPNLSESKSHALVWNVSKIRRLGFLGKNSQSYNDNIQPANYQRAANLLQINIS